MRTSLWRRIALPPPSDPPTSLEIRARANVRTVCIASAILFDLGLLVAARGSPAVRPEALRAFGAINVSLLAVDLALTVGLLRERRRGFAILEGLCAAIEIVTMLVWVQLTGVLSSYFIVMGPAIVSIYRSFSGYWTALWAYACLASLHAGAVALESAGLLRPAGLFVDGPGGIYTLPIYRTSALTSVEMIYAFSFYGGNFIAAALRDKDQALSAARREVERAIEEGQPGRLVGATLGGYTLVELLGRGGSGEVYRATARDGGDAAVKVLHRQFGADPESIARFRREIDVVRKLQARGIPELRDEGVTDGIHWLAMELLRGEDLAACLRRRERLPIDEVLPIVDALADVLDAAHAAGIVHRDVKPQNVFLATSGVKLLDFSIARLLETDDEAKLTMTFAVLGTPGYLAPEQISPSLGDVGPPTDVFALGAVVYRALTGRAAFETRHLPEALNAALNLQPPAPSELAPDLPPDVDHVIALAIAKRPRHRYATARELAHDLRAASEGRLGAEVKARAAEFAAFSSPTLTRTQRAEA